MRGAGGAGAAGPLPDGSGDADGVRGLFQRLFPQENAEAAPPCEAAEHAELCVTEAEDDDSGCAALGCRDAEHPLVCCDALAAGADASALVWASGEAGAAATFNITGVPFNQTGLPEGPTADAACLLPTPYCYARDAGAFSLKIFTEAVGLGDAAWEVLEDVNVTVLHVPVGGDEWVPAGASSLRDGVLVTETGPLTGCVRLSVATARAVEYRTHVTAAEAPAVISLRAFAAEAEPAQPPLLLDDLLELPVLTDLAAGTASAAGP